MFGFGRKQRLKHRFAALSVDDDKGCWQHGTWFGFVLSIYSLAEETDLLTI